MACRWSRCPVYEWLPRNVNVTGTLSTSLPVVTALLAQLSTATFLVPLASSNAQDAEPLGLVPLSPDALAVILGIGATGCFVLATVTAIHALAQSFDALPQDRQHALFSRLRIAEAEHSELRDDIRDQYQQESLRWYGVTQLSWQVGLALFALSIGTLAHRLVSAMYAPAALLSAVIGWKLARTRQRANNLVGVVILSLSVALLLLGSFPRGLL
jgi:hypothetical protein